jgi:hypothetical protein
VVLGVLEFAELVDVEEDSVVGEPLVLSAAFVAFESPSFLAPAVWSFFA